MCYKPSAAYLVWRCEFDQWLPGDLAPLCAAHGAVMRERIQRAEVQDCDLLDTRLTWDTHVKCAWDFSWPLTDEFRIIQAEKL